MSVITCDSGQTLIYTGLPLRQKRIRAKWKYILREVPKCCPENPKIKREDILWYVYSVPPIYSTYYSSALYTKYRSRLCALQSPYKWKRCLRFIHLINTQTSFKLLNLAYLHNHDSLKTFFHFTVWASLSVTCSGIIIMKSGTL